MTDAKPAMYELSALFQRQAELVEQLADNSSPVASFSGEDRDVRDLTGFEAYRESLRLISVVANSQSLIAMILDSLVKDPDIKPIAKRVKEITHDTSDGIIKLESWIEEAASRAPEL